MKRQQHSLQDRSEEVSEETDINDKLRETSFTVHHETPKSASHHLCLPDMMSEQDFQKLLFKEAL